MRLSLLPNVVLIQLGHSSHGQVDCAVQRLASLQLDQVSELAEMIDQVKQKKIPLDQANQQLDPHSTKQPRQTVYRLPGLLLILYWTHHALPARCTFLLIAGSMGILVGLCFGIPRHPRFNILVLAIVSIVVSTLIFQLTRLGFITGPANLLIAPGHFFAGKPADHRDDRTRFDTHLFRVLPLIYGGAVLALLFIGIAVDSTFPTYPIIRCTPIGEFSRAPLLGTLLFGFGTYLRLSGANRDLFWMLLVLYIAMLAQVLESGFSIRMWAPFLVQ